MALAAIGSVGCGPTTEAPTTATTTAPHAPPSDTGATTEPTLQLDTWLADDLDSFVAEMCVYGQTVYVLFRASPAPDREALFLNASSDGGSTWLAEPVPVNHGDGAVFDADLHCDALGVMVAWEDDRGGTEGNHQIYVNRSADGGRSFAPDDVLIDADPDGAAMSVGPSLTASGSSVAVAWYDNVNGAYDVLLAQSDDRGQKWRSPVRLDNDAPGSVYSGRPNVAMGEGGDAVWVAWEDMPEGHTDVHFSRSGDGGASFGSVTRLDGGDPAGSSESFGPQVCSDGETELYVVWFDARHGDNRAIYANHSTDGGATWQEQATRVDSTVAGRYNALNPVCALVQGTLHVAWYDDRNGSYDVFHRRLVDGVPGDAEVRLDVGDSPGASTSLDVQIATDGQEVVVAWRDSRLDLDDDGRTDLYYHMAPGEGAFVSVSDHHIDDDGGESSKADLHVAIDGGDVLATWTDVVNGTADISFRRQRLR